MFVYKRKFESKKENGRSMLEMLAVLAVIGILTIAGIVGYQYAMTKYAANTLANEINLTANTLAHQINRGANHISLTAPYDDGSGSGKTTSGYDFDYGCSDGSINTKDGCTQQTTYYVAVNQIPTNICKKLTSLIQFMPELTALLVNGAPYISESDSSLCKEENTSEVLALFQSKAFEGGEPEDTSCQKTSDCATDFYCVAEECAPCPETTHRPDGKEACFCADGTKWSEEKQKCESLTCTSNEECDSNYYCLLGTSSATTGDFCKILTGSCKKVTAISYQSYTKSTNAMNYRSASNFCAAQGKSIASLSQFISRAPAPSPEGVINLATTDVSDNGKAILSTLYGGANAGAAIYIQDDMGVVPPDEPCVAFMFLSKYPYFPFNRTPYAVGAVPYNMDWSAFAHYAICQ